MKQRLCKLTCTTVASVHVLSISQRLQIATAHGGKRLYYMYALSKLTASSEKRKPRICHGKLTTATNRGPLMEGNEIHTRRNTLILSCRFVSSILNKLCDKPLICV